MITYSEIAKKYSEISKFYYLFAGILRETSKEHANLEWHNEIEKSKSWIHIGIKVRIICEN